MALDPNRHVNFAETLRQESTQQYTPRYPLRRQEANMAEAVDCQCFYCYQQCHCPTRKAYLKAQGLNGDRDNETEKTLSRRYPKRFGIDEGRGCEDQKCVALS